jgi:O-antigen/teichoic acid export membrane protein
MPPAIAISTPTPETQAPPGHFRVSHLQANLKGRSIRGATVSLGGQAAKFALQIGSTVILARLLTPGDFGLVAMVTAVTGFVTCVKDAGLSAATVQREEIDHAAISTLFWINLALSAALMLVVAALAPAIALLYGDPRLVWITLGLAGCFIFSGLTVQHQALLRRQMRFGTLVGIDLVALVIGITAAIAAAAMGAGYWSLVAMVAATSAANAAGVWVLCAWRPGLPSRSAKVRGMLAFGGNLTLSSVVNNGARNLDNVLIGSVWGATLLGAYTKAYQLLLLPFQQFAAPITAVALPVLSRLQADGERFRRYFRNGIFFLTVLGMPVIAFAFVMAGDLVLLVLGDQWTAAVPIFRALAPAAFIETFNVANGWAFTPFGRTDRYLRCVIVSSAVIVAAFAIGLSWGAIGVACGYSIARIVLRVPQAIYAFRGTPLRLGDLGAAIWRPAAASLLAASLLAAVTASPWWPGRPAPAIGGGVLVYGAVYALLLVGLPGGRACLAQVATLRSMWRDPR